MRSSLILFLLCCSLSNAQTAMGKVEADAFRTLAVERASKTTSIVSDFIQYRHLDFLSQDIVSEGKLWFKTPDKVKWHYEKPFSYSVWFGNGKLHIDNEGHQSEVDLGASRKLKQFNKLIAQSVKGDLFDTADFKLGFFKVDAGTEVRFTPKNPDLAEIVEGFVLTYDNQGNVTQVKMLDSPEDYTLIVFSNRVTNKPVPDAVFAF